MRDRGRIVLLAGGVGGAKLADGFQRILPAGALSVVVNTGDDLEVLGLRVCPDIDTNLYTLSGRSDTDRGWGRRDETWSFMETLRELDQPSWFNLGDRDLGLHVWRSERLRRGDRLTEVTREAARRFGLRADLLPMTDLPVRTWLETAEGRLDFQDYFVRRRCEPRILEIGFAGAPQAHPSPGVRDALQDEDLLAVVIAPSNPFVSIAPILAVPGMPELIRSSGAPVVAVTPLPGGQAVKGPAGRMMADLGLAPSWRSIALHYAPFADAFVFDLADAQSGCTAGSSVLLCDTLMRSAEDRSRLAGQVLAWVRSLGRIRP